MGSEPWRGNCTNLRYHYRLGARKRGLAFALTPEQFLTLVTQPCHYCGLPPAQVWRGASKHYPFTYSGLDRKDNTQGYVVGNVLPCCTPCNQAKMDRPYHEYVAWVLRSAAHLAAQDLTYDMD